MSSYCPSLPEAIEGFDIERGVRTAGGDCDLYHDMLLVLRDNLDTDFQTIVHDVRQDRGQQARAGMHTLKGLAATIGATRLEKITTDIYALLVQNSTPDKNQIDELQLALDQTRAGLHTVPCKTIPQIDVSEEEALLARQNLRRAFQAGEIPAPGLAEKVAVWLRHQHNEAVAREFLDLVTRFEYDKSLDFLNTFSPAGSDGVTDE